MKLVMTKHRSAAATAADAKTPDSATEISDKDDTTAMPGETIELSESLEDYLEAILAVEIEKGAARPKDVADRLAVSAPSVTVALQNLSARGLVNYAPYDLVTLTERGRRLAMDVRRRHDALCRFFSELLRLEREEADNLACRMEHSLPPHALGRLVEFMDFIEGSPFGGVVWTPETGFVTRSSGAVVGEDPSPE